MKIMMLAAGQGTRLKPHTNYLPKPAIPFLNIPLYLYSLNLLNELSIDEVVFNTFHLPDKMKESVKKNSLDYQVHFSDESTLLGSGGGLNNAKGFFLETEDFALANADEVIIPNKKNQLREAFDLHKKNKNIATLIVMDYPGVGSKFGGVWTDSKNKILGFGKIKPEDSVKGYHYTGICILNEKIFNYLPEGESNILHDGVLSAIKDQQRVEVFNIDCHWFETGNEDDFKAASKKSLELLKTNSYSGIYLNALIAKFAPNSRMVLKEHQWILYDQSSKFNPDHVQGFLVIGSNSKLPSDIIVKNSVIGENVEVRTHQNINNKLLMYGN